MIRKLFQNQAEKVKKESWSLNQDKFSRFFFYLLLLFLPTQFGKHFWPNFSFVFGLRLDYLSPTLYVTDIIIFLIFVFSFKSIFKTLKKIDREKIVIFLLFIISLITGILLSNNPQAGVYGIIKILEFSFLTFFVFKNINLLNKKILFLCLFIALLFESSLSFIQYINQSSINGAFYFLGERTFSSQSPGIANASINGELVLRPYGTFSHPNVLAGFFLTSILFLFLFFSKFKYSKQILFIGVIIATFSLILTFSRLAILVWVIYISILFVILMVEKYKKKTSNSKILVTITSIILFLLLCFNFFQNSVFFQRFSGTRLSDESFTQRQELVTQSVNMFYKNPIFGVGINNFYNNLNLANEKENLFLIQPVHNIVLFTLSQTGLVGFIFFVLLFYKMISKQLIKVTKEKIYILMLIFAVLTIGMFDHYFLTLQQGQIILALIIGTALSYKST